MSTVADVIDIVRLKVSDTESNEWSDAQVLTILKEAINRIDGVLYRNDIQFFRKEHTITTVVGQDAYDLPSDFGAAVMLTRDQDNAEMTFRTLAEWRQINSAGELTNWIIKKNASDVEKAYVKGTPGSIETLTLDYYPVTDTSTWATSTTMPFNGRLDYILADYSAMLIHNINEADFSQDIQLLQDLENNVLAFFSAQDPLTVPRRGWNTGETEVSG